MATETNDLQIVITAINKATAEIKQVADDLNKMSTTAKKAGTASKDLGIGAKLVTGDIKGLALAVGLGTVGAEIAIKAFDALAKTLTDVLAVARNSELAWVRIDQLLLNASKTIGVSYSELKKGAEETGASAIKMGFDEESVAGSFAKLVVVLRDVKLAQDYARAAQELSAQSGDSLETTTGALVQSTQGRTLGLRQYGIILDSTATKEEILAKVMSTVGGTLEKKAGTTAGAFDIVDSSIKHVMDTLGKPINEALGDLAKELAKMFERNAYLLPIINKFLEDTASKIKIIYAVVINVVGAFEAILGTVMAVGQAVDQLKKGNIEGAKATASGWANAMGGINDSINTAWNSALSSQKEVTKAMGDDVTGFIWTASEEWKKAMEDMAKAYEKYMHDVENTNKEYQAQLSSLVIAHREAYKQISKDIKDENTTYKNSVEDMTKSYNLAVRDMEQSHTQKTKSVLADILAEQNAYQDEIDTINGQWNAITALTEGAGQDRLANLQAQLDKEKSLGAGADQEKVTALETMVSKEKEALDKAIVDQQAQQEQEINKATEKKDAKVASLQEELATENEMYAQSLADRKTQYDDELSAAKETHDAKLKDLKVKLSEENDIRKKYAADFKKIGDQAALDDITTLKNKHEETLKEMQYQYNQQTKDLQDYLSKENQVRLDAQADFDKKRLAQLEKTSKAEANILDKYNLNPNTMSSSTQLPSFLQPNYGLTGFAEGGLITKPSIVGENGYPEVVLPLNEPQRMAEILKGLGISGGGEGKQIIQNFNVTVNNQADVDMIMERASFRAKYL